MNQAINEIFSLKLFLIYLGSIEMRILCRKEFIFSIFHHYLFLIPM